MGSSASPPLGRCAGSPTPHCTEWRRLVRQLVYLLALFRFWPVLCAEALAAQPLSKCPLSGGEASFPSCRSRAPRVPAYLPVGVVAPATCAGGQGDRPGVHLAPHPAQDEVPGPAAPRASRHAIPREVSWEGKGEEVTHSSHVPLLLTRLCPLKQPPPGHHSPPGERISTNHVCTGTISASTDATQVPLALRASASFNLFLHAQSTSPQAHMLNWLPKNTRKTQWQQLPPPQRTDPASVSDRWPGARQDRQPPRHGLPGARSPSSSSLGSARPPRALRG